MTVLENYFNFLQEDDIRINGTRIGIETILESYLNGTPPETIADRYPNLSLEQVYATITYYLANRPQVDAYLEDGRRWFDEQWRKQTENPDPVVKRLRELKKQRKFAKFMSSSYECRGIY